MTVIFDKASATIGRSVQSGSLPGAVLLIAGPRKIHLREAFGSAGSGGAPMRVDTLFRIASLTKPVVSAAALRLAEAGRLDLQDAVTHYVPELSALKVRQASDENATEPLARPITVLDLLTHGSGLAYPSTATGFSATLLREFNTEFLPNLPEREWLARLAEVPLEHQPGDAFTYGFSTDVLGLVLSRITGRPLGSLLQDELFEPLGMADTTFLVAPENQSRLATAYAAAQDDSLTAIPSMLDCQNPARPGFESGGAGLVSTAGDFLRFARFLLAPEPRARLLSRRSIDLMTSNHLTPRQRLRPTFGAADYWREQGFGLGVSVLDRPRANRAGSTGRFGWAGAYGTLWWNDPRNELCVILMTQVMTGDDPPPHEVQLEADLQESLS